MAVTGDPRRLPPYVAQIAQDVLQGQSVKLRGRYGRRSRGEDGD